MRKELTKEEAIGLLPDGEVVHVRRSGTNDFNDAVIPVHNWLRENGHPHMIVVVDLEGAQAFEGVAATPFVVPD